MVIRIRRWVAWWFCLGVICGAVALINIFFRDLTRKQDQVILFLGVVHWLLGGLVCWAWEGVRLDKTKRDAAQKPATNIAQEPEHVASQLVVHTRGQAFRPRSRIRQELLVRYLLWHWEHIQSHRP